MIGADRQRAAWADLPRAVKEAAELLLNASVVSAATQNGGFSAGSADRVILSNGRRAFIKTADPAANAETVRLHSQEARIVGALPPGLPVAYSLGHAEVDGWVVAAYEDVDGRHPSTPWREVELRCVLDAFARLTSASLPAETAAALPTVKDDFGSDVRRQGWATASPEVLAAAPLDGAWLGSVLNGPLGDQTLFLADLEGDRLVHFDARADNILLQPDGTAVVVDWPWAARGAGWIDAVCLLFNVAYFDESFDPRPWLAEHPAFERATPEIAARFLLHVAGNFLVRAAMPEPAGIPGLRRFQRDQALACLRLVRILEP